MCHHTAASRLHERIRVPWVIADHANHTRLADFVVEPLRFGRRYRRFNVSDDFRRESLHIEIDTGLPSQRVIQAMDELVKPRGAPRYLRLHNGPEFLSAASPPLRPGTRKTGGVT